MSYIIVECNDCKEQLQINGSDFDFGVVDSNKRKMGVELTYEGIIETSCKNGHSIEVTHRFWEYPEGTENHKETEVSRASVIKDAL